MTPPDPWWASGRSPDDGLDASQDPLDAHQQARRAEGGPPPSDAGAPGDASGGDEDPGSSNPGDAARLASDAIDLISRLAAEAGRRVSARATANASGPPPDAFTRPDPAPGSGAEEGRSRARPAEGVAPHADGEVCDACPVCIGLRALRQVRPEVIAHLSDAAHHVSLALRAFAEAQAGERGDGLERIDLDQ